MYDDRYPRSLSKKSNFGKFCLENSMNSSTNSRYGCGDIGREDDDFAKHYEERSEDLACV